MRCANCNRILTDEGHFWDERHTRAYWRLVKDEELPFCHIYCFREYSAKLKRRDRIITRIYGVSIFFGYLAVLYFAVTL